MSDQQTVTAEDLVKAIQSDTVESLAAMLGWSDDDWKNDIYGTQWPEAIHYIASHITLPAPTIAGTLNGEAATFEVVYRESET